MQHLARARQLVCLVLLLTACSPIPGGGGVTRSVVTITGSGIEKSASYAMSGDYIVNWTATPSSDSGCYHGANLESVQATHFEMLVNEMISNGLQKSGNTHIYALPAGDYYINAASGCAWSFTFTPV